MLFVLLPLSFSLRVDAVVAVLLRVRLAAGACVRVVAVLPSVLLAGSRAKDHGQDNGRIIGRL